MLGRVSIVTLLIGLLLGALAVYAWARARLGALATELGVAQTRAADAVAHERALAEARQASLGETREQLSHTFRELSQEALEANLRRVDELSRGQLQAAQIRASSDLDQRRRAVEELVAPLARQLEALQRERIASGAQLSQQIQTLAETQERLRRETGALVSALRRPNTRGQWGQMQLRRVVEMAGMLAHCDFSEQTVVTGPLDARLIPDMVISLPGGKQVPVDAKAPLNAVLDAYEATDEHARSRALAEHARLLRRHVKGLADKAYWDQMAAAPDFVVLFLPGEHLLGGAYEADPELIEYAMERRVLITSPTTLLALLHSVGYGWQQERVAASAEAISELGRELHGRIARMADLLGRLGDRLNASVRLYNETVGSFESRVLPGARRFVDHGVAAGSEPIAGPEPISLAARGVRINAEDARAIHAAPTS